MKRGRGRREEGRKAERRREIGSGRENVEGWTEGNKIGGGIGKKREGVKERWRQLMEEEMETERS